MQNKINQHFFAYILCSAMILALGMYFGTANHNHVNASQNSAEAAGIDKQQLPVAEQADIEAEEFIAPIIRTAVNEPEDKVAVKEAAVDKYETTAYFLNVRANAYGTSKIINVVEKGTVLEVLSVTKNGWLRLEGGGYVHGGFARLVADDEDKDESEVKVLSAPAAGDDMMATPSTVELAEFEEPAAEPLKPTSAVLSDSGLTAGHIAEIFEGTALADHELEQAILEIEDEYGINAYFTIAVMKLESGNGSSRLAKKKNNLFGLNAIDGDAFNRAFSFETKGDSVRKFGQLIAEKYVDKGYVTVEKVARKYCPANPKWPGMVKSIMNDDFGKV
ncbi:glucosaminidase domain-containing protein [Cohnella kolymensis]|uniref:glucosaminidase domain-containing protein n=1 Tax=Cohnella kolymensis TaxID=1590652 RepID=UPI0006990412|nr:glucosaminidase domain-containing protein [Cohnella kolymensis]